MDKSKIKGYCLVSSFTVILYLVLTNLSRLGGILLWLSSLLSPFLAGIIIAFVLDGVASFLERRILSGFAKKTKDKTLRTISVAITLLLALGVIALLFIFILPQLIESIQKLAASIPFYLTSFHSLLDNISAEITLPDSIIHQIDEMAQNATETLINYISHSTIPSMLNFAVSMGNGIFKTFITLTVSIYLLLGKKTLLSNLHRLLHAVLQEKLLYWFRELSDTALPVFRKYINGQLLDASIVGLVSIVFLSVAQFPYAILIGVMMGVSNVIPFFGPFIGAAPSFLLILMIDPIKAVWYLIFVIVLQQLDGNVLAPKIIGDSVGIPPLYVLFSVTVGGSLFGIPGMIFGTPVIATIYAIVKRTVKIRELKKNAWRIPEE